jgi:TPP-dependent pyruvate/acetoin dehydrogenase alpha subunit
MPPDSRTLYALMLKCRLFEEAVAGLWQQGLISGEMHLGTGEEAVIAGVVSQLREGDAMALDHRGTAALLVRGVDPGLLLREMLGRPDGLCSGMGGHMHLFSREHLAASSGIIGASGPAAVGFALAARQLCPGAVAVAFFGEGAMNQGMLLESLNLAAAWKLPVVFVCKDDGWAITTRPESVTAGSLEERARGLGVPAAAVDGLEVLDVWEAGGKAIERARSGGGPSFLHARCVHLEGHFLGFQLLRLARQPLREMPAIAGPLMQSFGRRRGAPLAQRLAGLRAVLSASQSEGRDPARQRANDPLNRARSVLRADPVELAALEEGVRREVMEVVSSVLQEGAA